MPSSPPSDAVLDERLWLIVESYRRLTGKELLPFVGAASAANHLSGAVSFAAETAPTLRAVMWNIPRAIVAHGIEPDPVFFYGNDYALRSFEMDFEEFARLPSRLSAEPMLQEAREKALRKVAEHGYIDGYSGMRIAKSGRRFMITDCTIWTLIDADGTHRGQAAV
ncbi:MAG: MEKHLA domain-containing protein, partial [Gallionellaceae bacterium]|nr:MEKHLA domain-containing protein [Gallionellaceae bacterium]